MRKGLLLALVLSGVSVAALAADLEAGKRAYVIHDGQALLADKDPDAASVAKLDTHHAYSIVQISGQWAQLKTSSATGWVYAGNLSADEPPEVNNNVFKTESSSTTLNAAARGLDNDAQGYANRKGEGDSASDIVWMEHQNDAVDKGAVRTYLKEHKLGEYSGGQ